jgi:hypothetical protein
MYHKLLEIHTPIDIERVNMKLPSNEEERVMYVGVIRCVMDEREERQKRVAEENHGMGLGGIEEV